MGGGGNFFVRDRIEVELGGPSGQGGASWRGAVAGAKKGPAKPFQLTAAISFSKLTRFNTRFKL